MDTPLPLLSLKPYIEVDHSNVESYLRQRSRTVELLRQNLIEAQQSMKYYADKKRTEREFVVGDYVYLRLQLYRQNSLHSRRNLKLAPKYFGSFLTDERIGGVAYRLKLPPTTSIHPVFHVSLLKKQLETSTHPHLLYLYTMMKVFAGYIQLLF
ncbi:hypothetical protein Salat_1866800 [Sesamum alatum]|uniref:Tf2-1-like SH3-like domain-containing protein n=1 Tax=Sesamum alatum TaxID=300844 RepID=A0AAE1Y3I3_9LAMI|nr:hypothetical protein Salat_1866800 [Sesamum alatum]